LSNRKENFSFVTLSIKKIEKGKFGTERDSKRRHKGSPKAHLKKR